MNKIITILLFAVLLSACGEKVRVGTGEIGKVIDSNGMESSLHKTSSFRLPSCYFSACPYIVRLQITKAMETIKIDQVFIPASKVDLKDVEIGVQFQVRPDEESINTVFKEIRPGQNKADQETSEAVEQSYNSKVITSNSIWRTYLERKIPDVIVDVLRDYTVEDVLTKIPEIRKAAEIKLQEQTKDLPVMIVKDGLTFPNGIGDIPPEVISSYRKLYAVEADKQRQIKELSAHLEIEKQRLIVQRVRADNDKEIAGKLGLTVDEYMKMKIAEKYADAVSNAADNDQPFALGSLPLLGNK